MKRAAMLLLTLLASPGAFAACEVRIEVGDNLEYSKDVLTVDAGCDTVTVNMAHTGQLPANAMGHDWVLSETGDARAVVDAGSDAGFDNDYQKAGDKRIIAATPIIGGGESTSVSFSLEGLDPSQSYTFFCTFPGHYPAMKGTFEIE